jgi:hypothetical protein
LGRGEDEHYIRAQLRSDRLCGIRPPLPDSPGDLYEELGHLLALAFQDDKIKTHPKSLLRMTKPSVASVASVEGAVEIMGGAIDFRLTGEKQFIRHDGARFNFGVIVTPAAPALGYRFELHAYRFHLQFPADAPLKLLRFDLNPPGHANADRSLRCHMHVNTNNEQLPIPSPLLSPQEILGLFIYDFALTGRARAR